MKMLKWFCDIIIGRVSVFLQLFQDYIRNFEYEGGPVVIVKILQELSMNWENEGGPVIHTGASLRS